ncbi:MAG TPA: hemerythrin domain-containing protein, partial [Planctomycetota bacterium]|nr:hemerythrin domain-containing protein [Planctomycetota bacterium]
CLEALANQARAQGRLDRERAAQALEVLCTFADRCHHGKEEDLLFAWMARRGMPTHVGPIAVMLDEHKSGRALIARMQAAVAADEAEAFAAAGLQYVVLLRDHIAKEDGVLFPMAESMLDDAAREELLAAFRTFEHEDLGSGVHERMLAIADALAAHYGVQPAAERAPTAAGSGCCGHATACH